MARVKITEYRAKKIILGDTYEGIPIPGNGKVRLSEKTRYVVKVDQGVKKRFKQGLVALDKRSSEIPKAILSWKNKGFIRFLAEPYLPHEGNEEKYLSLERVRDGIRILYASEGGIDIEEHPEKVLRFLYASPEDSKKIASSTGLKSEFLDSLVQSFEKNFFAFLEINPLVVREGETYLLDAAALVDSAAAHLNPGWSEDDIVEASVKHPAEDTVKNLQKTTPASLKLNVIDPAGSIFFLLSGGGGSIVIADVAALKGAAGSIGNYGEYSGGPTREETYLYAREIIGLMLGSRARKKALVIAGGVANFTDIKRTFAGIIDALSEKAVPLQKGGVKVFVRRGGPHEAEGLALMRGFLEKEKLLGSVYGSDAPITKAIEEALAYAV